MTGAARLRQMLANRFAPLFATTALTAIGAVLATWPLAREMGSATLLSGEVLLTAWQLNWYHQALSTNPLAWVDANIFFPYDRTATFNDLLMSHAFVTLPVAWAESPVLALNLALLVGIVLCCVCSVPAACGAGDARWAAAVGAILFASRSVPLPALRSPVDRRRLGGAALLLGAAPAPAPAVVGASGARGSGRHRRWPVLGLSRGLCRADRPAGAHGRDPARAGWTGVWLPLLATGLPCLALLIAFLLPYAQALHSFGVAAAPDDLIRYGADLSSLGQKPGFLSAATDGGGINPEAHLYPGAGLAWLTAAVAVVTAASVRKLRGWRRGAGSRRSHWRPSLPSVSSCHSRAGSGRCGRSAS